MTKGRIPCDAVHPAYHTRSASLAIIGAANLVKLGAIQARLRLHTPAALPGLLAVALMLVWGVHDGGYDAETWYWGALVSLGLLAATSLILGRDRLRLSRESAIAIALLGLYVAWSYLSIAWAQSPGDALQGSNKALLYLLLFALLLLLPWTPEGALVALVTFVVGIGVIGVVLLFRLAADDRVSALVIEGRLAAPTGYFNSTAALFTMGALAAILLATRRELPGVLRGLLLAFACSGLQLALIVQSRGWLFTLPLVAIVTIVIASDRLRLALIAILPLAGAAAPIRRLLDVYQSSRGVGLDHAAARAGQTALLVCAAVLLIGTIAAWGDGLLRLPSLSRARQRAIGGVLIFIAIVGAAGSFAVLTHGHPLSFISRQWRGFSHPQATFSSTSHFGDVGSERYDFWREALDATLAHPIGGLGQDNFADYYIVHGHTGNETNATHSLELRLLAHTGIVGLVVFTAFLIAVLRLWLRARRARDSLARGVAAAALVPLVVWLIHGSIDWFWEFPALTGPALGFLATAGALGAAQGDAAGRQASARIAANGMPRWLPRIVAGAALTAAVVVLGLPYLAVREVSLASNVAATAPAAALNDLSTAAQLNPLSSVPDRIAGTIALQSGQYALAEQRFARSISHEPGGWYPWLGAGLAASALGQRQRAHADFVEAERINHWQAADGQALARVYSKSPLTSAEAFKLLVIIH